ncbi:MAG: tetratricopeptide repeat protein [Proteobacteria bacterium]|nr:tetratricopeptide repeat protein [Pseudomonadota bacterium]
MDQAHEFKTICVISGQDDHLRRDKLNVKRLRPQTIMGFSSGGEAAAYLANEDVDCIICDSNLGDMDGCKFMRIIRQMPRHRKSPLIMVTVENQKNAVLDSIAAGCTGYVLRPYSEETLQRHLMMAVQLQRFSEIEVEQLKHAQDMVDQGDFDDAIEEFEEILSLQDEAQKYYDLGCDYLIREKYGKAIISFNKALKINDLFAEAYQGLAEAYKGKGNLDRFKSYLQKAAEVHAQFDRLEQAKTIFIEILKHDTKAPNPYNTLGVRLRRAGDYPGAVRAYRRALEITPQDENIYFNISKAYFYMGERSKAQADLKLSLAINPYFPEAAKFFKEVMGTTWMPPAGETPLTVHDKKRAESIKDV